MNDLHTQIDAILARKSSKRNWRPLIDTVRVQDARRQREATAYVLAHPELSRWPSYHRACATELWEEVATNVIAGQPAPIWWPLVHHVEYVSVETLPVDTDIGPIELLASVPSLHLVAGGFVTFETIVNLPQLRMLKIVGDEIAHDTRYLSALVNMEELELTLAGLRTLDDLVPMKRLNYLDLSDCTDLVDIGAITAFGELAELILDGCRALEDLTPLLALPKLRHLDLGSFHDEAADEPKRVRGLDELAAKGTVEITR